MRVLMLTGPDAMFGGHAVQRDRTAAALRSLGVDVVIDSTIPDGAAFDVVHAWWPELSEVRRARQMRLPVATSTIYIPQSASTVLPHQRVVARARMTGASMVRGIVGRHMEMAETLTAQRTSKRLLFESSDLLLPNSVGEAELLTAELGVSTPSWIIRNAIDPSCFRQDGAPSWSDRSGVLIAARVEPHKGQLAVINALKGTDLPLYVAGALHPHHRDYFARCERAAQSSPNVRMVGRLDPPALANLMRRVRVHVLPSQWETTGLCSLEAAACGCNVVVSDRGQVREYVLDDAFYCGTSVREIRRAVLHAHEGPQRPQLGARITESFTWRDAAADTLAAYDWLLSKQRTVDGETRLSQFVTRLDQ
jgi:glycosyltransferase involved in cell wall biosynthesis